MNNHIIDVVGATQVDAIDEVDDNLVSLIEVLLEVDITNPIAKLNETTISDNNGGRIEL
jgi:hypothetical protein